MLYYPASFSICRISVKSDWLAVSRTERPLAAVLLPRRTRRRTYSVFREDFEDKEGKEDERRMESVNELDMQREGPIAMMEK